MPEPGNLQILPHPDSAVGTLDYLPAHLLRALQATARSGPPLPPGLGD